MNRNVEHMAGRLAHGLSNQRLLVDDHGAQMDAPDWIPHGATKAVQMIPESKATYRLITGHNTSRTTKGSIWQ